MSELTAEQRQQRCDWARGMWEVPSSNPAWQQLTACVDSFIDQGLYGTSEIISMFQAPKKHPAILDALFEEWANRKLLGEIT